MVLRRRHDPVLLVQIDHRRLDIGMAKIEEGLWNKEKTVGQMAPLTPEQAGVIRSLLTAERKIRDLTLFNTALDTMLRVIDITDHNGDVVHEFMVKQRKTGRGHLVALSPHTRDSIGD